MDVSVIIPVYNDAGRVSDCVNSVLGQKCSAQFEIIVVNDGSDDNTSLVLEQIKGIVLLKNDKNLGQSSSRNMGASLAKGKYLFFLDSDVVLEPGALSKALSFIALNKTENIKGIQGTFMLHRELNNWASLIYNALQHLLTVSPRLSHNVNTSCFLIEKEAFHRIGGFKEDIWYMEDVAFGRAAAGCGMLFGRNIIFFKHKKHLNFSWLLRQHFIGGIQLSYLNKAYPLKQAGRYPYDGYFLGNILKFPLFIIAVVLSAASPLYFFISLIVLFSYYRTFGSLYKTYPNVVFVGLGFIMLNIIPFVIGMGAMAGSLSGVYLKPADRILWVKSNSR